MYGTRPFCQIQAITRHTCPDLHLDSWNCSTHQAHIALSEPMSNIDQQGSCLGSFPLLYPHFNRPSGFWPCVKPCLVGDIGKYRFRAAPFYQRFWGNWLLEIVIKLFGNFRSCILVILPNKRVRRSLSDSFRFLLEFCFSEEVFPSFLNTVITFERILLSTLNNTAVFVTLAPAIRAPTVWPLLKFDRSANLYIYKDH